MAWANDPEQRGGAPEEGSPCVMDRWKLVQDLAEAEVIIDASASVAVSRYLADLQTTNARRICVFFNPTGARPDSSRHRLRP